MTFSYSFFNFKTTLVKTDYGISVLCFFFKRCWWESNPYLIINIMALPVELHVAKILKNVTMEIPRCFMTLLLYPSWYVVTISVSLSAFFCFEKRSWTSVKAGFSIVYTQIRTGSLRKPQARVFSSLVDITGLEPVTIWFEVRDSIHWAICRYFSEGQAETLTCFANVGFRWRNIVTPRIKW